MSLAPSSFAIFLFASELAASDNPASRSLHAEVRPVSALRTCVCGRPLLVGGSPSVEPGQCPECERRIPSRRGRRFWARVLSWGSLASAVALLAWLLVLALDQVREAAERMH